MNDTLSRNACAVPRSQWPRLLGALPAQEIKQCADELMLGLAVSDVQLPRSGLGLLQLRDTALADSYFLGEIPITRAHIRLTTPSGESVEGAAQLLDDRASIARSIAVLDAVKAAQWRGHEQVDELLQKGLRLCREIEKSRKAVLAHTRVDFALLGATDEEDEEDA